MNNGPVLLFIVYFSVAPEVPVIDQAYSKLSNSITVEWAEVAGATSYQVIAQAGTRFFESVVTSSPGTVTGLQAATTYKITVRSINSAGKSQPSPPKWAQTGEMFGRTNSYLES